MRRDDGTVSFNVSGEGPLVVFLHGWTVDRRMWRPQMSALAGRYRVIALDRRGFGQSTAPADMDRELTDISALLDLVNERQCALVGMSQGGRVALRYARSHGERVRAIVLQGAPLDGFPPAAPDEAIPVDDYRRLWLERGPEAMKAAWRSHPHMQGLAGAAGREVRAMLDAYEGRDLVSPASAPSDTRCRADDLPCLAAPILAITGQNDTRWLQAIADEIAVRAPRGERYRVAGAGHFCNLSHSDDFNTLAGQFLDRILHP